MVAHSDWQALKVELRKEVRSIFNATGMVVLIEQSKEFDSELTLRRGNVALNVTFVTERHEVRWETDKASGFEQISEPIAPLAAALVKRVVT